MRIAENRKLKIKSLKSLKGIIIAFFALSAFSFQLFAIPAFAATACTCFCGSALLGAVEQSGTSADSNACISSCLDQKLEPEGCYTRTDNYPENSESCWRQEECTLENAGNVWADNVAACDDRKEHMGYCYAAPLSFTSMISLGGDNTFSGLPDYISTLYRFLVPAMVIIAVIMVMVGGLQYILSRGNASAVKQAKERMTQAVIGLVLLMSAFTLANLLDPHLVNFDQLRVPKVKKVVLLTASSSCSYLASVGIAVDHVEEAAFVDKTCSYESGASKGVVTSIENADANANIGGWKVGDECNYTKCDAGAKCTSSGCRRCAEVGFPSFIRLDGTAFTAEATDPLGIGELSPTSATCSAIGNTSNQVNRQYCMSTAGGSAAGQGTTSFPGVASFSAECVNIPVRCATLWANAGSSSSDPDACGLYGKIEESQMTTTAIPIASLFSVLVDDIQVEDYAMIDNAIYEKICNDDPCNLGWAQFGGTTGQCKYTPNADGGTCTGR